MISLDDFDRGTIHKIGPLRLAEISGSGGVFLDIGGGLRILQDRGDRYDRESVKRVGSILQATHYMILDPVTTYRPHVTGDIHDLPFADDSIGAIWCSSVLEHVQDPQRAAREIYRVLRKGGGCFVHVPFLFRYHPAPGYYNDYWRFTEDGVRYLLREFEQVKVVPLGLRFETLGHLLPGPLGSTGRYLGRVIDSALPARFNAQLGSFTKGFSCICIK
jgi:SAM-dependent methyltransferase